MKKVKVLIVDDHEMVRMGLSAYLSTEDSIEVVGEASNGEEAIELARELEPEVILMDLIMEKMNGIEATREIKDYFTKQGKSIKIIALTSFIEEDTVFEVIKAGAFSYLLKTSSAEKIVDAIQRAVKGESVLENKVTNLMINKQQRVEPKHNSLTKREMEVLLEVGRGKTNQEIADTLFIGIKTVKTHVSNILSKLELEDRTKAAIYANEHGLTK